MSSEKRRSIGADVSNYPGLRHAGAWRLMLILAAMALWAGAAEWAGPAQVPTPWDVSSRLRELTTTGVTGLHVAATLRLSTVGFAYGFLAGLIVPLLLWAMPRVGVVLRSYVAASAGLPKYALMPLLILWLGIDTGPALWLIGLLVFYPIFFAVDSGLRGIDRRLVNAVRIMGGSRLAVVRLVGWHAVAPFLSAALRIAVPRAVSAAIVAELLIGSTGIGSLIEASHQNLDAVGLFAAVILAAVLVASASLVTQWIERAVTGRARSPRTAVPA